MKKGLLRNCAKFTGKHLCLRLFFNKAVGLSTCNFIEKETLIQVLSCEFCEISKNTFFTEHLWATASGNLKQTLSLDYPCNASFKIVIY